MRKQDAIDRRWHEIESMVRHMCQIAQESGPVAAKTRVNELMPKLRTIVTSIVEDERAETACQYEL